jgi:hypothetical protein
VNTFLTVNVSPHLLGSGPVRDALGTRPDLHRVVIELTEHTPVDDLDLLRRQCDELRMRGALIALDDAGSGYSGLQQLAALRPQVVKLDHVARARLSDSVASLLRPVRQVSPHENSPAVPPAVLTGQQGEPTGLLLADPRTAEVYTAPVSLRVHASDDVGDTLRRALTRPPAQRFDPVVCTDPTGTVLGLLRVEDLASAARTST